MTIVEMLDQMRREREAFFSAVSPVQASVGAMAAVYRSALADLVSDSAGYVATVKRIQEDAIAAARTLQPVLDLIETTAERQRAVASALEVLRPVEPWKPRDAWLGIPMEDDYPVESEDNRPYPGQYL